VKATDGGGLISPNVATGNVSVENVNMKKPVVVSARVELLLPTSLGVLVHRVEGAYMNEPLRFDLLSPTPYFGIKSTSGVIFTSGKKLDREEETVQYLLVEVTFPPKLLPNNK
jgi:hypothetical protein